MRIFPRGGANWAIKRVLGQDDSVTAIYNRYGSSRPKRRSEQSSRSIGSSKSSDAACATVPTALLFGTYFGARHISDRGHLVAADRKRARGELDNIVEQDHRATKRRCSAKHGLKAFGPTAVMIAGIELAHRIGKPQFSLGRGRGKRSHTMKTAWDRALFGY